MQLVTLIRWGGWRVAIASDVRHMNAAGLISFNSQRAGQLELLKISSLVCLVYCYNWHCFPCRVSNLFIVLVQT